MDWIMDFLFNIAITMFLIMSIGLMGMFFLFVLTEMFPPLKTLCKSREKEELKTKEKEEPNWYDYR